MKYWPFFLFILSTDVLALEAVVTVLETPLFSAKDYSSKVVQYLRKGDVIKIHPAVANDREMDRFAPPPEKLALLKEKLKKTPEYNQDPIFKGEEENTAYLEDEFIPTLDRQGKTVYVLSSHIYVYFNDKRELQQKVTGKDPTDYRLEEPLPKHYPLKSPSGYRGQFLIGLTQPVFESYNYPQEIRTKGYSTPLDLSYTLLRQAPGNYQERLFVGGSLTFKYYENSFTFSDKRFAEEEGIRLGLGPTISFDAFKGEKNRLNLTGSIIVNVFDRLSVTQKLADASESRQYIGYSVAPRLSMQYHRKEILEDLDFVLATNLEVGSATSYRAKNAGRNPSWWQETGNDKFTTRTTFTLGGYIGVQAAY